MIAALFGILQLRLKVVSDTVAPDFHQIFWTAPATTTKIAQTSLRISSHPGVNETILCVVKQSFPRYLTLRSRTVRNNAWWIDENLPGLDVLRTALLTSSKQLSKDAEFVLSLSMLNGYDVVEPLPELSNLSYNLFVKGSPELSQFLKCTADSKISLFDFKQMSAVLLMLFLVAFFVGFVNDGKLAKSGIIKRKIPDCVTSEAVFFSREIVPGFFLTDRAQGSMYAPRCFNDKIKISDTMKHTISETGNSLTATVKLSPDIEIEVELQQTKPSSEQTRAPFSMWQLLMNAIGTDSISTGSKITIEELFNWLRRCHDMLFISISEIKENGEYELIRENGSCPFEITKEMLAMANCNMTVMVNKEGKSVVIARTNIGDRSFVCVTVAESHQRMVMFDGTIQCYMILVVVLSNNIHGKAEREESCRRYLSMVKFSHAFSVIERNASMNQLKQTGSLGQVELLSEKFMKDLSVEQQLKLIHDLKKLTNEKVGFSRVPYRFVGPDGKSKWIAISGHCSYDETYESDVFCFLGEDISKIRNLEDQIRETSHDLELASRLLGLHKFSHMKGCVLKVEGVDLIHSLGYKSDSSVDLLKIMHPDDVKKYRDIHESEIITIRLMPSSGDAWQWFTMVCTSKSADTTVGLIFNVQEMTQMQSTVQSTRDCFEIGSATNQFAFWALNLDTSEPPHAVFTTKPFHYLIRLCHPESVRKLDMSTLRNLTSAMVLEIKLRMTPRAPYQWFTVTLVPSSSKQLLCFAFNTEEKKKTHDMLRQTQQLLDMAFTYSDVRMWTFEDRYKDSQIVTVADEDLSHEMVMDWSTLEHNLVPEYQQKVTDAFKNALNGLCKLEIEVPFFFDNLHWLLLRGLLIEDDNKKHLTGIYLDLTTIKEAAHQMEISKAQAEEASSAKSTFLANTSHEIRTPLNGMCGLLEILQTSELTKEQRELTNCIQSSFVELLELLNDTLDLAKLESKKLVGLCVKFDPCEVIGTLQESIFHKKRPENVIFRIVAKPSDPIMYRGDPHCFVRIITNLLYNACKFTHNGSISITLECVDDCKLRVIVRDTGTGMSPSIVSSIQDHFDHGETMAVYEETSVGVGLSLVTEMVRFMKGTIAVDSHEGTGSCFTCELPFEPVYAPVWPRKSRTQRMLILMSKEHSSMVSQYGEFYGFDCQVVTDIREITRSDAVYDLAIVELDSDGKYVKELSKLHRGLFDKQIISILSHTHHDNLLQNFEMFHYPLRPDLLRAFLIKVALRKLTVNVASRRPSDSVPTDMKLHVLAVDDNRTNQLVIKRMLTKLGCSCVVVSDGQEAVDAVQAETFDLVLMDQFMPVLDGLQATKKIRELPGDVANVPVIAMTASIMQEDEEACKKAGMNAFICKPVTLKNLSRVMSQVTLTSE